MDLWAFLRTRQRRHGDRAAPVSIFAKDLANVEVFQVEKQTKQIAAGSGMAGVGSGRAVGRACGAEGAERAVGKVRREQRGALEKEAKQFGLSSRPLESQTSVGIRFPCLKEHIWSISGPGERLGC